MLSRLTNYDKNKALVGKILVEYSLIEHCIRSIVFEAYKNIPTNNNRKTFDDFYNHIDYRINGLCKSTDKIFKSIDNRKISLKQLIGELSKIRNIAAHQTDSLVNDWSSLPDNEIVIKRNSSTAKLQRIRHENTIMYEDDYQIIITRGRGTASLYGDNYIGSLKDLFEEWKHYSGQFETIYGLWNSKLFNSLDLDGRSIEN